MNFPQLVTVPFDGAAGALRERAEKANDVGPIDRVIIVAHQDSVGRQVAE